MIKKMKSNDKTYLLIDSRERDIEVYPEPNKYVINLENIIKNVESINLVHAIYPKKHGTEIYVNLHIDEFNPKTVSNNNFLRDSFAQLPMIDFLNEYKHDNSTPNNYNGRLFEQPLAKLSKLSISFIDFDGELSVMGEHFLKFEVEYSSSNGIKERIENSIINDNLSPETVLPNDSYEYNLHGNINENEQNLFHNCKTLADLGIAYSKTKDHIFDESDMKIINEEYDKMQKHLLNIHS